MFQDARQMLSGRTPLLLWRVGKRYRVQSRFLVVIDCYRAGMNQSNIVRTNNTLVWWTKMTLSTFRSQRFLSEKNQDRTNYALLRAKNSRKTCTSTRTREYHTPTSTIIPRMILLSYRYLLLACLLAWSGLIFNSSKILFHHHRVLSFGTLLCSWQNPEAWLEDLHETWRKFRQERWGRALSAKNKHEKHWTC